VLEFEEKVIVLLGVTEDTQEKKIIMFSFNNKEDFSNAKNELKKIGNTLFEDSAGVYYKADEKQKTIVLMNQQTLLEEVNKLKGNSDLAKVITNLANAEYEIVKTNDQFIRAIKPLEGVEITKTVSVGVYENKNDLEEIYEGYLEKYAEEIKNETTAVGKKGTLIIVASSKYALKDALGK